MVPAVMSRRSIEDSSGEILRSFLTLCSPTSVSDDTGDRGDVETGITFSVKDPCLVSTRGGRSSFLRFGGGGSSGSADDGVDMELLNLHLLLLVGRAKFEGGVGTPPVARGIRSWMEGYYVDGSAHHMDPDDSQATNLCIPA